MVVRSSYKSSLLTFLYDRIQDDLALMLEGKIECLSEDVRNLIAELLKASTESIIFKQDRYVYQVSFPKFLSGLALLREMPSFEHFNVATLHLFLLLKRLAPLRRT